MKKFFSIFLILISSIFSTECMAAGYAFFEQLSHVIHLKEHVLHLALVAIVLIFIGFFYRSKVAQSKNPVLPDRGFSLKNLIEFYGQFIMNNCKTVIGEEQGPKYFNFCAMMFIFILFSNLIGIVPGFLPPTQNLNTTLALGLITFVYFNIKGCKEQGTLNYLKHFAGPIWYMGVLIFPLEILSACVRPISLALRLRGNMYGDHIVLGAFYGLVPLLVPIAFYILGLLVSFIQAYVFTMLTMVYISLAVSHHAHDESHAH
jgi:F-type H+-transporting ATPase subunit a